MNRRQRRFVAEYLVDLNATQAAIRAGYSDRSAYSTGERLLRNAEIAPAVEAALEERAERSRLSAQRVLEELFYLCTARVDDFELGDTVRPRPGRPLEIMRAVSSVKRIVGKDGESRVELRLWDKTRALELAARHLGMFAPDRVGVSLDATPRMSLEMARAIVELGRQYRADAEAKTAADVSAAAPDAIEPSA